MLDRLKERGISAELAKEVIRNPDRVDSENDRKIAQKLVGGKLLSVIYEEEESIIVISAYRTSKAVKYLREWNENLVRSQVWCIVPEIHGGKGSWYYEVDGGVLIDYGDTGQMIGIEIINVSSLIKANPLKEIVIKIQEEAKA
jgi:hypothetical protein